MVLLFFEVFYSPEKVFNYNHDPPKRNRPYSFFLYLFTVKENHIGLVDSEILRDRQADTQTDTDPVTFK